MQVIRVHEGVESKDVTCDWLCQGCRRVLFLNQNANQVDQAVKAHTHIDEVVCPDCNKVYGLVQANRQALVQLAVQLRKKVPKKRRILFSEVYLLNQLQNYLLGFGGPDHRLPTEIKNMITKQAPVIPPETPRSCLPPAFYFTIVRL